MVFVNGKRLLSRINELGKIGKDEEEQDWRLLMQINRAETWFLNG